MGIRSRKQKWKSDAVNRRGNQKAVSRRTDNTMVNSEIRSRKSKDRQYNGNSENDKITNTLQRKN